VRAKVVSKGLRDFVSPRGGEEIGGIFVEKLIEIMGWTF